MFNTNLTIQKYIIMSVTETANRHLEILPVNSHTIK